MVILQYFIFKILCGQNKKIVFTFEEFFFTAVSPRSRRKPSKAEKIKEDTGTDFTPILSLAISIPLICILVCCCCCTLMVSLTSPHLHHGWLTLMYTNIYKCILYYSVKQNL